MEFIYYFGQYSSTSSSRWNIFPHKLVNKCSPWSHFFFAYWNELTNFLFSLHLKTKFKKSPNGLPSLEQRVHFFDFPLIFLISSVMFYEYKSNKKRQHKDRFHRFRQGVGEVGEVGRIVHEANFVHLHRLLQWLVISND